MFDINYILYACCTATNGRSVILRKQKLCELTCVTPALNLGKSNTAFFSAVLRYSLFSCKIAVFVHLWLIRICALFFWVQIKIVHILTSCVFDLFFLTERWQSGNFCCRFPGHHSRFWFWILDCFCFRKDRKIIQLSQRVLTREGMAHSLGCNALGDIMETT